MIAETATIETPAVANFAYSELDPETRIVVQQEDKEFDRNMQDANTSFVHACMNLQRIHDALKYKRPGFEAYCQGKGIAIRTAYNMLDVAGMSAKYANIPASQFGKSALYLLAAPSTPDDARQEAIERAQNGEVISYGRAREIVMERRPEPPRTEPRPVWQLQNDMLAWLAGRPEADRLMIAEGWRDQTAESPFWVSMIQALPKPWRHADVQEAIGNVIGILQRHKAEPIKAEANSQAAPVVEQTPLERDVVALEKWMGGQPNSREWLLSCLTKKTDHNHSGVVRRVVRDTRMEVAAVITAATSILGRDRSTAAAPEKTPVQQFGEAMGLQVDEYGYSQPAADPDGYASIRELEQHVRQWLKSPKIAAIVGPLDCLTAIKEKQKGHGLYWENLKSVLDTQMVTYVVADLRQACNNVLDQMRSRQPAQQPPAPIEINGQLRDSINSSLHIGPKADAEIKSIFMHNSRPHIAVAASYIDNREEYEAYQLVDLAMYQDAAGTGLYGGLPVSYVGHGYRLGNPVKFCYEPPAQQAMDLLEVLIEKLAGLDVTTRKSLAWWVDQRTNNPWLIEHPAALDFIKAVVALLMANEVAA